VFIYSVARHGAESTRSNHAPGDRYGGSESGRNAGYSTDGESNAGADSFAVAQSNDEPDADAESDADANSDAEPESFTSAKSNANSNAW
jgi:hypothetical protein